MKFKRKKSRRSVRCTMCTKHRWYGNRKGRYQENKWAHAERAELHPAHD